MVRPVPSRFSKPRASYVHVVLDFLQYREASCALCRRTAPDYRPCLIEYIQEIWRTAMNKIVARLAHIHACCWFACSRSPQGPGTGRSPGSRVGGARPATQFSARAEDAADAHPRSRCAQTRGDQEQYVAGSVAEDGTVQSHSCTKRSADQSDSQPAAVRAVATGSPEGDWTLQWRRCASSRV